MSSDDCKHEYEMRIIRFCRHCKSTLVEIKQDKRIAELEAEIVKCREDFLAAEKREVGHTRRIALLERILRQRDGDEHDVACVDKYPLSTGPCICGHDEVIAYFKEQGK